MVYVDQSGNRIENPDLSAGYLIDKEWIDHPGTPQKGHYEYKRLPEGGMVQTYVVDEEATPGWREVTVQVYIPYGNGGGTDEGGDAALEARVTALEETIKGYEDAYTEGVEQA